MDDATLAAQFAKTGNIMDLFNTPEWLQEIKDNEFDGAGTIGAGLATRSYVEAVNKLTSDQLRAIKRKARLQAILFTELSDWMQTWDLGIGFENVYIVSRRIVREHLELLNPEQQAWIETLLIEDKTLERGAEKPVRQQTKAMLAEMFTADDWKRMADTAAQTIKDTVLQVGQVKFSAPDTVEAA
ncbi:MAG: hypothetical protein AAF050_15115 [Cyanobacteria bacterium J06649_5]